MVAPVVVVGAGPAGLAVAAELSRRSIESIVLEQGASALSGLRKLDPDMRLLSPRRFSALPKMTEVDGADTYMSISDYIERAERYRTRHGLNVETGVAIDDIAKEGDHFVVSSGERQWRSKVVVYAGGTLSTPRLPPELDQSEFEIPHCHSRELRAADLATGEHVVVVGQGNSAVEALHTCGSRGARISLSVRGSVRSVPRFVLGLDVHYLVALPEKCPTRLAKPLTRVLTHEPAFAMRDAIERTGTSVVGAIRRYLPRALEMSDGQELAPDRVVFATGYEFRSAPLGDLVDRDADGRLRLRNCESARTPDLFVLGARFGRTFASHFLRGIAADSPLRCARDREQTMKTLAVRATAFGGPEVLEFRERELPTLEPGVVGIDVRASALNFSDIQKRSGLYPGGPVPPFWTGVEGAGVTDAGERVAFISADGAHARRANVPRSQLIPIPSAVSFEQAAAFPISFLTAHHCLETARASAGEHVLVTAGAGALGAAAIQLALRRGCVVTAAASTEDKRSRIRELGAEPIAYDQIGSSKPNVVLDGVGGDCFARCARALKRRGRIVMVGAASGKPASIDATRLIMRSQSVHGFHLSNHLGQDAGTAVTELLELVAGGALDVGIGHRLKLNEIADAHRLLGGRKTQGKVVLTP